MSEAPRFTSIEGGSSRSPSPRPRLAWARSVRLIGGTPTKIINGRKVCYLGPVVVFVDYLRVR